MEVSFNDVSQVQKQLNYFQNIFFNFLIRNFFKKPCIYTLRVMFFIAGFHKIKVVDKGLIKLLKP